jgi:hypothetical protein
MINSNEILYKTRKSKVIRSILLSFLLLFGIGLVFLHLYFIKGVVLDYISYIGISLFGIIGCFPGLLSLQNHYDSSKGKMLRFSKSSKNFSFWINGLETKYNTSDVKIIVNYYTSSMFYTPFSQHEYYEFVMKDNKKFIISDLIVSRKQLIIHFPKELIISKNKMLTIVE